MFEQIEADIAHFSQRGNIIISGDLNARTGQENDFIMNDYTNYIPLPPDYQMDNPIRKRLNQDKICRGFGKSLIDLCKTTGLRILNGRTLGDSFGKLTCHQYNGSSAVDYTLAHYSSLPLVNFFKVHDWLTSHSDHCPISFSLSLSTCQPRCNQIPLRPIQVKYKWDTESDFNFKLALRSFDITGKIQQIITSENSCTKPPSVLLDSFTNILHTVADRVLRKKKFYKKRIVRQKWFDISCVQLKRECNRLGKIVQTNPNDSDARSLLFLYCCYYYYYYYYY